MHAETEQVKGFAETAALGPGEAAVFVHANACGQHAPALWTPPERGIKGKHPELEASLPRLFQRVLACAGDGIGRCVLARRGSGRTTGS